MMHQNLNQDPSFLHSYRAEFPHTLLRSGYETEIACLFSFLTQPIIAKLGPTIHPSARVKPRAWHTVGT